MKLKRTSILILGLILLLLLVCGGGLLLAVYTFGVKSRSSVIRVTQGDENLQTAAKIAQKTLPQFLSRLAHPEQGDRFAIKVKFKTPVGPEYLWLKDPKLAHGLFTGILDQTPIALPSRKGDKLSCKREDIYDWLVKKKDGSMAGGFTEIALDPDRG